MKREDIKNILSEYTDLEKSDLNNLVGDLLTAFHSELDEVKSEVDQAHEETESKKDEYTALEKELEESKKTIKNLQEQFKDQEAIQEQIQNYETTISELKENLKNEGITNYLNNKLSQAGAIDIEVCERSLDFDKSLIRDEKDYQLIDQAIKTQKKEKAFLYKDDKQKKGYSPRIGTGRADVEDNTGKEMAKLLSQERKASLS